MFLDGLRKFIPVPVCDLGLIHCSGYITNKATIKMEYIKYNLAICELHGVQVVGLPSDIELLRAGLWNLETVRRVHAGLKDGSVCWVKMTKTEHEALIVKHNTLRAESASGSLKQRATRSDKGTRCKKTGEKEGTGCVQPTARIAFAGMAGGGGRCGAPHDRHTHQPDACTHPPDRCTRQPDRCARCTH
jgi:hypothetical protein